MQTQQKTETFCLLFIWQKRFSGLDWCSLSRIHDFHSPNLQHLLFSFLQEHPCLWKIWIPSYEPQINTPNKYPNCLLPAGKLEICQKNAGAPSARARVCILSGFVLHMPRLQRAPFLPHLVCSCCSLPKPAYNLATRLF